LTKSLSEFGLKRSAIGLPGPARRIVLARESLEIPDGEDAADMEPT
jgi:hypothetical protein